MACKQYLYMCAVPILAPLFERFRLGLYVIDGTNIVRFTLLVFLPANLALPDPDEF